MKKYVLKDITLEYTIRAIESLKREQEQLYRGMQKLLDYKDFAEESKEYQEIRQRREAMRLEMLTLMQVEEREKLRVELKKLKNENERYSNEFFVVRKYIKELKKKQPVCIEYAKLIEKEKELEKKERATFRELNEVVSKIMAINRNLIK